VITSTPSRGSGPATTRTTGRTSTRSGTGATARRPAAARRPAQRVAHLVHLDLDALRDYRQELITEESRVSYWRRILQARIDTAVGSDVVVPANGRLRSVLTGHQESSRRLQVLPVHDASELPPLPDLTALWETVAAQGAGTADEDAVLRRLTAAEAELSAYRRSLHERLDDATSELIARYRDHPALALRALPLKEGNPAG
jgi:hypothetical protein